jgi:YgiT-type zinc finger domain-containing protein
MNICPTCHMGKMQPRKLAYVQWLGENLVLVERMPALVCDVCGESNYNKEAMENLQRLLWADISVKRMAGGRPAQSPK